MSKLQHGVIMLIGLTMEAPKLPDGFTIERHRDGCAIVKSPDGKIEYLVAMKPPRLVPILSRAERNITADFDNAIPL